MMKSLKLTLLIIATLCLFFTLAPQVCATGGPAGTDACCLVINPGSGALALKGTLALVYDPENKYVDVTLRLERSGTQGFFRLHLSPEFLSGDDDNTILCKIFDPFSTSLENKDKVANFVDDILATFFVGLSHLNTRLVITPSSASDYQDNIECTPGSNCDIGDTGRVSTLGDVTVFAVEASRVKPANPTGCSF